MNGTHEREPFPGRFENGYGGRFEDARSEAEGQASRGKSFASILLNQFAFARGILKKIKKIEDAKRIRALAAYADKRAAATAARVALLNPNEHSDVKIERYVFSLNPTQFSKGTCLRWGESNGWTAFKNPQVRFRAEELYFNVSLPGLCYVNIIQAANVNVEIGGVSDATTFGASRKLSLPTLPPQNTMQVCGTWSKIVDGSIVFPKKTIQLHAQNELAITAFKRRFVLLRGEEWRDVEVPDYHDATFTLAISFVGWATVIA